MVQSQLMVTLGTETIDSEMEKSGRMECACVCVVVWAGEGGAVSGGGWTYGVLRNIE